MGVVRPLIAGNWKMNGTFVALDEVRALAAALEEAPARCEVALCLVGMAVCIARPKYRT